MPDIVDAAFPCQLLAQDLMNLCLVQTQAPDFGAVKAGDSRPKMVETARTLLNGVLRKFVPERKPLVVVMPEYAFAPADWDRLDTIVKHATGTVVLLAGFGPVTGEDFCAWADTPGEVTRTLAFSRNHLAPESRYGGGWCWVREADGRRTCIAYAKNWRQQREELDLIDETVDTVASLSFKDVTLFPLLCSDMINERDERARNAVIGVIKASNQSALVIGSLWQEEPSNGLWLRALDRWAYELPQDRAVIALANHAMDAPKAREEEDRWRSLSGLFIKHVDKGGLVPDSAMRLAPALGDSAGMVVRRTVPCAVLGQVGWPPFGADRGRRLWAAGKCFLIGEDGAVDGTPVDSPQAYELARFLERYRPAKCDPLLGVGIDRVAGDLLADRSLRAELLHSTMLHGIDRGEVDHDQLHECRKIEDALLGLAYLFGSGELRWSQDGNLVGQAEFLDGSANVLVWRAGVTRNELRRKLQTWLNENAGHRKLLVLNKTISSELDDHLEPQPDLSGPVKVDRLTDISAPPPPDDPRPVDAARPRGRVECVPLGHVCETYLEEGEDLLAGLMNQLKERLNDRP